MRNLLALCCILLPFIPKAQYDPAKDKGICLFASGGTMGPTPGGEVFMGYQLRGLSVTAGLSSFFNSGQYNGVPLISQLRFGVRTTQNMLFQVGPAYFHKNTHNKVNNYPTAVFSYQYHLPNTLWDNGSIYLTSTFFLPTSDNQGYVYVGIGMSWKLIPSSDF